MGVEATEGVAVVMEEEEVDMEVGVEAMEVEAMEVEGDQEVTVAMEKAEKVMLCSLAAASVALFVGSCTKEISVCAIFAQNLGGRCSASQVISFVKVSELNQEKKTARLKVI